MRNFYMDSDDLKVAMEAIFVAQLNRNSTNASYTSTIM